MSKVIDLTGNRFERLLVISRAPNEPYRKPRWNCVCDCGVGLVIFGDSLRSGNTRSCGCYRKELVITKNKTPEQRKAASVANTIHGDYNSPAYISWRGMIARCTNPRDKNYKYYGLLGVSVCERWRNSFASFLEDMGSRPEGKTLDRFPDPSGDYELDNCRWATAVEQAHNKRKPQPVHEPFVVEI